MLTVCKFIWGTRGNPMLLLYVSIFWGPGVNQYHRRMGFLKAGSLVVVTQVNQYLLYVSLYGGPGVTECYYCVYGDKVYNKSGHRPVWIVFSIMRDLHKNMSKLTKNTPIQYLRTLHSSLIQIRIRIMKFHYDYCPEVTQCYAYMLVSIGTRGNPMLSL